MLIEGADRLWRQLLDELCAASDVDAMRAGFAALTAEASYRRSLHDSAEAKRRRSSGGPAHARLIPQEDLDAAFAEWDEITGGGEQPPGGDGD